MYINVFQLACFVYFIIIIIIIIILNVIYLEEFVNNISIVNQYNCIFLMLSLVML